jgi:hypothetical protein
MLQLLYINGVFKMSLGRKTKTEHNGAKNGGGYWGNREEAKKISNKVRRQIDKNESDQEGEEQSSKDQTHKTSTPS